MVLPVWIDRLENHREFIEGNFVDLPLPQRSLYYTYDGVAANLPTPTNSGFLYTFCFLGQGKQWWLASNSTQIFYRIANGVDLVSWSNWKVFAFNN